jgi:hypothetical protein
MLARRKARERERADPHPHEAQRRIADRGGHPPHLAIAALADAQLDPGGRNPRAVADRRIARPELRRFDAARAGLPGWPIGEHDTAREAK